MNLSQYKNIFGEPNTGLHSIRLFNIAIVDVLFTILVAYLIAGYTGHFWTILTGLFVLGIIMHRLFGVRTTVDKKIFPSGPHMLHCE